MLSESNDTQVEGKEVVQTLNQEIETLEEEVQKLKKQLEEKESTSQIAADAHKVEIDRL